MSAGEQIVTAAAPGPSGGRATAVRALGVGAALVVLWVAAFLFGSALLVVAGACTVAAVVVAWRTAGDWTTGKAILATSAALWVVCTVAFWWLWGVGFDAADALQPVPGYVDALSGPSLVVGAIAFVVFWGTLAWVVFRVRPKQH
jgi:hypothetical protein